MNKKEDFKYLIREFHSTEIPEVCERSLDVPLMPKKIITIYGPRRSGKSFYFYTLINKLTGQNIAIDRILYINFEDDRILPLNFKELEALLEAYYELYPDNKNNEIFIFFDEIQNIENWEIFVRRIYDKEKVRIFITGSSSRLLSKEIATSLRGRTISFALYPLDFKEFLKFKGVALEKNFAYSPQRFKIKKLLEEYVRFGGFPEVVLEENVILKEKILDEYFKFLIYRDIAERFSIENMQLLFDLLKFLFTNIANLLSINSYYHSVKQSLPVSRDTINQYLSFIQETEHIFLCPLFSYSLKTQRFNPKKIICIDNGLRNVVAFRFSEDKGRLVENLIGNVLRKENEEIYYWKNKGEVDFVFKEDSKLWAINVTCTDKIEQREINSLLDFKKYFSNTERLILLTKEIYKKESGIEFIPLWRWILENI